jgi:hypothetical protein
MAVIKCKQCNKEFKDYPSNTRTFCGFECYWTARKVDSKYKGYWTRKKRLDIEGSKNPKWKGNKVGYAPLHQWVIRKLGNPKKCEHCGAVNLKSYHWANKSGEYKRDVNDWLRLCVPCHRIYDGWTGRGHV